MLYPVRKVNYEKFSWESKIFKSYEDLLQKNLFKEGSFCNHISQYAIDNPELSGLFTVKTNKKKLIKGMGSKEFLSQCFFKIDLERKALIFDEIPEFKHEDIDREILVSFAEFVEDIRDNFLEINSVITNEDSMTYRFFGKLPQVGREITLWERESESLNIFDLEKVSRKITNLDDFNYDNICAFQYIEREITEENSFYLDSPRFHKDFKKKSKNLYVDRLSDVQVSYVEVTDIIYAKFKYETRVLTKGDFILKYPEWKTSFNKEEFNERFYLVS